MAGPLSNVGLPVAVLVVVLALPVSWVIAELYDKRWLRLLLGILTMGETLCVAYYVGSRTERFRANQWFGTLNRTLIDATVAAFENEHGDWVFAGLTRLQDKYRPTERDRSSYDALVSEAVAVMTPEGAGPGGFWNEYESGLRVAIFSDKTVVRTKQSVDVFFVLNNNSEKTVSTPVPDVETVQLNAGPVGIVALGESEVAWMDLGPGHSLFYSLRCFWSKPGAYEASFSFGHARKANRSRR